MNSLQAEHIAVIAVGGKIYAMGGMGNDYFGVQNVEFYDPATKKWTTMALLRGDPPDRNHASDIQRSLL